MALVIDQPGGHEGQGAGLDGIHAAPSRQRPYAYQCLNCGANNVGKIEDGCLQCGTGRGGEQKGPEPAVDFTCAACRGNGKVERRCAPCNGTGNVNAAVPGQPPVACLQCGGGGSVAMDCARCEGTGIDPEPQAKRPASPPEAPPLDYTADEEEGRMVEKGLPRLDDPQPGAALSVEVRRYLVVEIVGQTEMADIIAIDLLRPFDHTYCRRHAVEIAASPATDRLFAK